MKKILYLVNSGSYFLAHRLALGEAAKSQGYEVHVAGPNSSANTEIVKRGFSFHHIPFTRKGMNPITELLCIFKIILLYQNLKPDLVHHLTIKPMLYGSIAAKIAKISSVVNTVTGLGYIFTDERLFSKFLKWGIIKGYRHAFNSSAKLKVIFENMDDRHLFVQSKIVSSSQASLVRGAGVDTNKFRPTSRSSDSHDKEPPIIMLASRMLWSKGIGEFIDAVVSLKNQGRKARFVLVGDVDVGNPSSIPVEKLKNWISQGIIEWWGFQEDMPNTFNQASIVCLPSYREGLPMALMEAAACGKPLVTTNQPGCKEVVINHSNGILIPAKDASALAKAIGYLLSNPGLCKSMGEKGRSLIENEFSKEKVIQQTFSIYNEVLTAYELM